MSFQYKVPGLFLICSLCLSGALLAGTSDWPMWRYDPGRCASADIVLPDKPVLLWTRQMEEPKRCWPFQHEEYRAGRDKIGKLSFDVSYEPVIGDGRLFVPSMVSDRLTAYSIETGEELWRYYAGGPVRFAPVYYSGRIYFVSDDGYLYCLNAKTGNLIWSYFGSYSDRMVLGNERIISMWPSRGGPVIMDGIIYFASGVIPFEGIFVHAVDANNGKKIWTNSTTGSLWTTPPHPGTDSYCGPSPQGYLAINGNKLIVPGGRTAPAVFDRKTGEFLYFRQATETMDQGTGGYMVFTAGDWFFNHGMLFAIDDGAQYGPVPGDVINSQSSIGVSGNQLIAHNLNIRKSAGEITDRLVKGTLIKNYKLEELWKAEIADVERLYLKTRSHYIISKQGGKIAALINISLEGKPGRITWEYRVDGEIWSMLAVDGKLFIVSRGGKIFCFGSSISGQARQYLYKKDSGSDKRSLNLVNSIFRSSGVKTGYGMIYGSSNYDFIMDLVERSSLNFVVVEPGVKDIKKLRSSLDEAGIYGRRISVINNIQNTSAFLPYIYSLIIIDRKINSADQIKKIINSLRPYGGAACFIGAGDAFQETFNSLAVEKVELRKETDFTLITRKGSLPGSAQWTHQYGNAANTTYSEDSLVKPPLGTLWFGGTSNENVLPRHHMGPIPQVAGGRLFILGVETISARDVYTGRELWIRKIPGIGNPFVDLEIEQKFRNGSATSIGVRPGANFLGSPYISMEDVVYIIDGKKILVLDAATGDVKNEFHLPQITDLKTSGFSHMLVSGEFLISTANPQTFGDGEPGSGKGSPWNGTSSSVLFVMNRYSGELLWERKAKTGFRHNAIVAGKNQLFLIDGLSEELMALIQRRGIQEKSGSELVSLDLRTGRENWSVNNDVFGTWLGLYDDKNILLQGGRPILFPAWDQRRGLYRSLPDEPADRLMALNSSTGQIIWENKDQKYIGPLGLHPDMIITGGSGEYALNPNTGKAILKNHPLTGEMYPWEYTKFYGCGSMNCCRYLITFRSGMAGYNDLLNFGGTGNLGGFRAGCTNNLVAADGILNAPDYTRSCTCSYPLQSSFGLMFMPGLGIEMWTLNKLKIGNEIIRSLGINFGAPGNRRENGVLWLEYPKQCVVGPDLPVKIEPRSVDYFRNHATWIEDHDEKYNWVGSYGIKGISSFSVNLVPGGNSDEKVYNVTLYFAEPDDISAGERVFDITMQGKKVLEKLDIVKETGKTRRILLKEFRGVRIKDVLELEFTGRINSAVISGIEIVMDQSLTSSGIR